MAELPLLSRERLEVNHRYPWHYQLLISTKALILSTLSWAKPQSMFETRLHTAEILKALVLQSSEPSECNRSITENGPGELSSSLSPQESPLTDSLGFAR